MFSSQTLIGKILRLPLSLIPSETEIRILRGPLRGQKWIVGASTHACWAGTYEVHRLGAFARAIFPGATVYDIGANVGIYSPLASLRAGPTGKVYAFEPSARNLHYLRRHLALNDARNCVVLETAVSNTDGTCHFSVGPWESSMARLSSQGDVLVPSITLDNGVYGEKALRPPDVIKIDVEGAEWEVLQGANRVIMQVHPAIFLEVHGTELHANCRNFLIAHGYRVEEAYSELTASWSSPASSGSPPE